MLLITTNCHFHAKKRLLLALIQSPRAILTGCVNLVVLSITRKHSGTKHLITSTVIFTSSFLILQIWNQLSERRPT